MLEPLTTALNVQGSAVMLGVAHLYTSRSRSRGNTSTLSMNDSGCSGGRSAAPNAPPDAAAGCSSTQRLCVCRLLRYCCLLHTGVLCRSHRVWQVHHAGRGGGTAQLLRSVRGLCMLPTKYKAISTSRTDPAQFGSFASSSRQAMAGSLMGSQLDVAVVAHIPSCLQMELNPTV